MSDQGIVAAASQEIEQPASLPTTMKAIRVHKYGGPEVLSYDSVPRPNPGQGEILVEVHAAGVNPVDWRIREGYMKNMLPRKLPIIPGWDFSGVVRAVGDDATRFKIGDEVFARPDLARDGAYAQYIAVRQSEVANKPKSIDHIHAAAIPLAALTAWQALFDAAQLEQGQHVLIHAAAGGVGSFAVQLAKWRGAYVIGTASRRNHDLLRQLGVDEAIDYQTVRFENVVQDVDIVLDTMAGDIQQRSWKVIRRGGILVSVLGPPSAEEAAAHAVRAASVFVQPNADQLSQIAALVDQGQLRPQVEIVLPLAEARRAQELSQTGHARGKIVLKVAY